LKPTRWISRRGATRPIAFFSEGWLGTQLEGWTAQVKEQYAQRYAVCKLAPTHFPFADIILRGDNRNLAIGAHSEDERIRLWHHDIRDSGCIIKYWYLGQWNTIADYDPGTPASAP